MSRATDGVRPSDARVLPDGTDQRMSDLVARAIELLRLARVRLDPGLSDAEVSAVQERFGFEFGPEHRELIQSVLPAGSDVWPDWRHGSPGDLQGRLDRPADGVLFDVHRNAFWPATWGPRPDARDEREACARDRLVGVPRLIPLYSHRYLAAGRAYHPSPVLSVCQTDVIHFGNDLVDYLAHEFGVADRQPSPARVRVPFWSDLADGVEL